ncbi:MAG: uncharacterized protein JWR45_1232 [Blastococcus sp.]|jgi:hypothetical protein|nr:uncharacterized protein [Blastococcus sp.]
MSCSHCNAVDQRGRYCVGCGKLMPPSATPVRRVRLAPRALENDDTQPVLRFRVTARPPLRVEQEPAPV